MRSSYTRFLHWLDASLFPKVVAYATHPLVILLTILLLIPLIVFASITSLALILGNYTNVVSAAVSSIVLATSLKQHHDNKQMHEAHAADITALHVKIDNLTSHSLPSTNTPKRSHHKKVTQSPTGLATDVADGGLLDTRHDGNTENGAAQ